MSKIYLPFVFILFLFPFASAKHIIGGVMTYECLDNGLYSFTLKMYRDCSDPTGAGFDFNAPVSFYKGGSQNPLNTLFVSPDIITDVDPIELPCLILPANICVEEATYTFTYTFNEWPSTDSYHVAYQRCCRNATVSNMLAPDDTGATFAIEVTPASQLVCNSTPVYDERPPIVICAGEPLNFLHSATDPEGDQLIYELCAPLKGGGTVGGIGNPGDPTSCAGIVPNPACPPPYESIDYVPPYNPLNPLGGMPAMTINAVTGLLTGTPILQGQFVVGVCVSEYRNGDLLSVVRRDFQFNVASCEPTVFADIQEDSLLGAQDFLLRSCSDDPIQIINESIINLNTDEFVWQFVIDDSLYSFDVFEPIIQFPGSGIYEGLFVINPNDTICGDTGFVRVEIYPEITADFAFEYDTCVAGPVFFSDLSFSGGGPIQDWDWDYGNGETGDFQNPTYVYADPGEVPVTLTVVDGNGCEDMVTKNVRYFPVPALILVSPDDVVSCPPATITFQNLSSPIDDSYQTVWSFGDGGMDTVYSPTYTYAGSGLFSVNLEIISPIGCVTDTTFSNLILVEEAPVAGFDFDPLDPTQLRPEVHFTDASMNEIHWDWYINNQRVSNKENFLYSFPDTGLQTITLVVTHAQGCTDTLTQLLDVAPETYFHLPNAFTPNYDDVNDFFGGTGILLGIRDFQMTIWDRWGGVAFYSTDPLEYWNGMHANEGRLASDGVYVCLVSFTGPRGKPYEYKSFVTLMR